MPLAVVVLVALVLLWWLFRPGQAGTASDPDAEGRTAPTLLSRRLAFVARGKLFYANAGEALREVHSPHVQSVIDRAARSRELHAWKEGTAFGVRSHGRGLAQAPDDVGIHASTAALTADGQVLYFLRDHSAGGLFAQDLASGKERRLLHRQNLLLDDLRLSADGQHLLAAQRSSTGIANIVRMGIDGEGYRELTGGDTLDTAPTFVPGQPHQVVFQSAGIARNPHGFVAAIGPVSVQLLDTGTGALTPILDHPAFDHLQPRVDATGNLLYIRRPFEGVRNPGGQAALDVLLFPFRLLRALFHYLNFFSLMYTRKPLTSAGGPEHQTDLRELELKGRRIDAEAALRRGAEVAGVPSLVPASWELIRRDLQGREQLLARHVASFDLAPDGSLLYSNGYGVFRLDERSGRPDVVLRDKLIADVVAG